MIPAFLRPDIRGFTQGYLSNRAVLSKIMQPGCTVAWSWGSTEADRARIKVLLLGF